MYYVIQNKEIVLFDKDKAKIINTLSFMPQYKNAEIKETEEEITEFDGKFYFKKDIIDKLEKKAKEERKSEICSELADLDIRRIRAMCEPSLKDEECTWLEYYNNQVLILREELKSL